MARYTGAKLRVTRRLGDLPGFTSKSMFPMLWNASGLNIEQLVAKIIDITLGS